MILIHIGAPKTGSTSAHAFLDSHGGQLERLGVAFPDIGRTSSSGHVGFRFSIRGVDGEDRDGDALRADYDASLKSATKALITSEFLWAVPPVKLVETYPILTERSTQIYFLIREQSAMVRSHYKQRIKGRRPLQSVTDFAKTNARRYDFAAKHRAWAEVFGDDNIHIDIFEDLAREDSFMPAFFRRAFDILDVGAAEAEAFLDDAAKTAKHANRGVPDAVALILKLLGSTDINDDDWIELRRAVMRQSSALQDCSFDDRHVYGESWTEAAKRIREKYAESNAALKAAKFSNLDRDTLFPEDR